MTEVEDLLPEDPPLVWDDDDLDLDEELDAIDEAVMRRGTLNAETIDWGSLKANAVTVLSQRVDLGALRALFLAEEQANTPGSLSHSITLLSRLSTIYWKTAVPTSERRRRALVEDCLKTTHRIMVAHIGSHEAPDAALRQKIRELAKNYSERGYNTGSFEDTMNGGSQDLIAQNPAGKTPPQASQGKETHTSLDAQGRAKLRRDIRALAERISAHEPDAWIAYRMRSYAAWLEHSSTPPADSKNRIEQYPMPSNIVQQMQGSMDPPSAAVLAKFEAKLYDSPDWFEGHKLASDLASSLGFSEVSASIKCRVEERLASMPELFELRYTNDSPLVPDAVRHWLENKTQAPVDISDQEEIGLSERADIADPLQETDALARNAKDGRARTLARLALAKTLLNHGFSGQAQLLLTDIKAVLSNPLPLDWEDGLKTEVGTLTECPK